MGGERLAVPPVAPDALKGGDDGDELKLVEAERSVAS